MKKDIDLMTVLQELHNITGFRISIHDKDFNELMAYPKDPITFCQLIRSHPEGLKTCKARDYQAFKKVTATGELCIYRCPFGLYEAVAPVYRFDILTGYLMMGQSLESSIRDTTVIYSAAAPFANEQDSLTSAVNEIPLTTQDKIRSCLTILNICADYITLTNRLKLTEKNLPQQVQIFIHEHYNEKLSIDLLCKTFYCSRSTLINSFKRAYHTSINDYITKIRIRHAKELLAYSEKNILNIALECGFSDQNYFCKVFGKEIGTSPTSYRKSQQQP